MKRKLREEKLTPQSRIPKGNTEAKLSVETTPVRSGVESLEGKIHQLESRVEILEVISAKIEDVETRLDGTPALDLRQRFKCDCGASGFVALHARCTKCGEESWWGWFPKK